MREGIKQEQERLEDKIHWLGAEWEGETKDNDKIEISAAEEYYQQKMWTKITEKLCSVPFYAYIIGTTIKLMPRAWRRPGELQSGPINQRGLLNNKQQPKSPDYVADCFLRRKTSLMWIQEDWKKTPQNYPQRWDSNFMTEKETEPRCRRRILDLDYPVPWIYSVSIPEALLERQRSQSFHLGGCEEGLHTLAALPCLSPENCGYKPFTVPSKKPGINFW